MLSVFSRFVLVAALLFGSFSAHAVDANIKRGDWEVSGSASLDIDDDTTFQATPRALYFLNDGFALGASLGIFVFDNFSFYTFGPEIKYYFWQGETSAAYVSEVIAFAFGDDIDGDTVSSTTAGLNFFLTPSVALGPAAQFNYNFDDKDGDFRLLGMFSIYL